MKEFFLYPLGHIYVHCTPVIIILLFDCVLYVIEHLAVTVVLLKFVSLYFIPEEIGINSPDEREVILSEIYRRFHPEEEDLFEMEIQGEISSLSGMSLRAAAGKFHWLKDNLNLAKIADGKIALGKLCSCKGQKSQLPGLVNELV